MFAINLLCGNKWLPKCCELHNYNKFKYIIYHYVPTKKKILRQCNKISLQRNIFLLMHILSVSDFLSSTSSIIHNRYSVRSSRPSLNNYSRKNRLNIYLASFLTFIFFLSHDFGYIYFINDEMVSYTFNYYFQTKLLDFNTLRFEM